MVRHAVAQIANAKGMERTAAANHAAAGTRLALSQARIRLQLERCIRGMHTKFPYRSQHPKAGNQHFLRFLGSARPPITS